jgi:hypothetical protein
MIKEIESIIQDILLQELSLPTSYGTVNSKVVPSVYIVAPNISLGTTDKLQIGIQSIGSKIVSNHVRSSYTESSTGGDTEMTQYNEATIDDNLQIDISSKNSDARTRRHEVFMALNSYFSKQQQEKYGFRIFGLPSGFMNTSAAEGGTVVYRYSITFQCQYMRVYSRTVVGYDYYKTFPAEVINDGALDDGFTIDEEFSPYAST